jgi:hypothetical protein
VAKGRGTSVGSSIKCYGAVEAQLSKEGGCCPRKEVGMLATQKQQMLLVF